MYAAASVCHPKFKLRWLAEDKRQWAKDSFIEAAVSYASSQLTVDTHTDASTSNDWFSNAMQDDFFDFESEGEANGTDRGLLTQPRDQLSVAVSAVTIECLQYLSAVLTCK